MQHSFSFLGGWVRCREEGGGGAKKVVLGNIGIAGLSMIE